MKTEEYSLPDLPEGFDMSCVVQSKTGLRNTGVIRVAKSEYDAMERNHFKGWFAIPNRLNGQNRPLEHYVAKIVAKNGGLGFVCDCRGQKRVHPVKFVNAFRERNLVVIHIEPREIA